MPASSHKLHAMQMHEHRIANKTRGLRMAPISGCGGEAGQPYILDLGYQPIVGLTITAWVELRFPMTPNDDTWDDPQGKMPVRRIDLIMDVRHARPQKTAQPIRVVTNEARFTGIVIHSLIGGVKVWHLFWTAAFRGGPSGGKPGGSSSPSGGGRDPDKKGWEWL